MLSDRAQPQLESGGKWQYCRILLVVHYKTAWYGHEWFEAEIRDSVGVRSLGKSEIAEYSRDEPALEYGSESALTLHAKLIKELTSLGWELIEEPRQVWYQLRFRRWTPSPCETGSESNDKLPDAAVEEWLRIIVDPDPIPTSISSPKATATNPISKFDSHPTDRRPVEKRSRPQSSWNTFDYMAILVVILGAIWIAVQVAQM